MGSGQAVDAQGAEVASTQVVLESSELRLLSTIVVVGVVIVIENVIVSSSSSTTTNSTTIITSRSHGPYHYHRRIVTVPVKQTLPST